MPRPFRQAASLPRVARAVADLQPALLGSATWGGAALCPRLWTVAPSARGSDTAFAPGTREGRSGAPAWGRYYSKPRVQTRGGERRGNRAPARAAAYPEEGVSLTMPLGQVRGIALLSRQSQRGCGLAPLPDMSAPAGTPFEGARNHGFAPVAIPQRGTALCEGWGSGWPRTERCAVPPASCCQRVLALPVDVARVG